MRGSKTMGYEYDDSLTPALSRWERGRLGLFQQPVRESVHCIGLSGGFGERNVVAIGIPNTELACPIVQHLRSPGKFDRAPELLGQLLPGWLPVRRKPSF